MASSPRIDELRKKFEENPRRYFAPLANEYRKAGDVQQAIAICREYLPQQPGHMSGHIVFGQALYEARTFEEAKAVFETALSLDPENLIALRHLGDISLITGDNESARTWYKRVLEADPRNEEIQAQLATIEKASSSAPTPAISPAVPEPAAPPPAPAPTPASSAATVVMKAVAPPGRPAPTATSPTAEISVPDVPPPAAVPSLSAEPTVEVPQLTIDVPDPAPAAAPLEGLEGTHAGTSEAPISSFSLDGLETTSLSADAAPPPPPMQLAGLDFGPAGEPAAAPPPPPAPVAEAAPAMVDLDFAEPAAPTAPAPVAAGDDPPALDLDLGSLGAPAAPVAETAPAVAAAPPAPEPAFTGPADEAPLDLEISLPSLPEAPAVPVAAPEPEPVAASVPEPVMPAAEPPAIVPEPDAEPEPEPASPSAPGAPFLTETMAELYLQQGHRDEALRVYRALLEQRPGDESLSRKIASIEAPQPQAATGGPTIRELLAAIAMRRPGYRPEFPAGNGSRPAETAPTATSAPAPGAVATSAQTGESARGDALGPALGFATATAHDEDAAMVLAKAFTRNGRAHAAGATIAGAPARPATDDLSLRAVFRDAEPAPPPSSFSFDQFFSQRAAAEGHGGGSTEGQAAESAEDVAQFTQWLEGLKKR